MNWYRLWLFLHLAGVLAFVAGHGVSVAVLLRLRREPDPVRLEAMLGLSRSSIAWSNLGLAVLLVGGIANWIRVGYSPQGWLWTAAALLLVLAIGGVAVAAPFFRAIRAAIAGGDAERFEQARSSPVPAFVFWFETVGLALILWLMVYKPF